MMVRHYDVWVHNLCFRTPRGIKPLFSILLIPRIVVKILFKIASSVSERAGQLLSVSAQTCVVSWE